MRGGREKVGVEEMVRRGCRSAIGMHMSGKEGGKDVGVESRKHVGEEEEAKAWEGRKRSMLPFCDRLEQLSLC